MESAPPETPSMTLSPLSNILFSFINLKTFSTIFLIYFMVVFLSNIYSSFSFLHNVTPPPFGQRQFVGNIPINELRSFSFLHNVTPPPFGQRQFVGNIPINELRSFSFLLLQFFPIFRYKAPSCHPSGFHLSLPVSCLKYVMPFLLDLKYLFP